MGLYDGIKDVAKIIQKADNIELYQKLLDLSSQALELQNEILSLTSEINELKKKQDIESKICRHKELYLTLENEDSIIYCTHCWDYDKKLIQMKTANGQYFCPHCKTDGVYNKDEYKKYQKDHPRVTSIKLPNIMI